MQLPPLPITPAEDLGAFDACTAALEDRRPHLTKEALTQLGAALMTDLLDQVLGTALDDQAGVLAEALHGGRMWASSGWTAPPTGRVTASRICFGALTAVKWRTWTCRMPDA